MTGTDTFGARVRKLRHEHERLSMEALARDVGISLRQMNRIEGDEISPRLDLVTRIAERLAVPVCSLVPERAHGSNLPEPTGPTPQDAVKPHTNSTKNNGTTRDETSPTPTPRADQKRG